MNQKRSPETIRIAKQSRRLHLKDSYFYLKITNQGIGLIGVEGSLQSAQAELEQSKIPLRLLRMSPGNACAMWIPEPEEEDGEIIAFYKGTPLYSDFIVASVFDPKKPLVGGLGELSLAQILTIVDNISLPNIEDKIISIQMF
jgi:hypothetical protein